jgi:hypothetical protein
MLQNFLAYHTEIKSDQISKNQPMLNIQLVYILEHHNKNIVCHQVKIMLHLLYDDEEQLHQVLMLMNIYFSSDLLYLLNLIFIN